MAISRRITKTVTEDFSSDVTSGPNFTQGLATPATPLGYSNGTSASYDPDSTLPTASGYSEGGSSKHSDFGDQLHRYIGEKFWTVLGLVIAVIVSGGGLTWQVSGRFVAVEKDVESVRSSVNEVKAEVKETSRIVSRLETSLTNPAKSPTSESEKK